MHSTLQFRRKTVPGKWSTILLPSGARRTTRIADPQTRSYPTADYTSARNDESSACNAASFFLSTHSTLQFRRTTVPGRWSTILLPSGARRTTRIADPQTRSDPTADYTSARNDESSARNAASSSIHGVATLVVPRIGVMTRRWPHHRRSANQW